jgi:hypothetical protein
MATGSSKSRSNSMAARPGTGKAKRTTHLEESTPRPSRGGYMDQASGNPPGLRRTWNAEQLKERRIEAVKLRVNGIGYREIGAALGVPGNTAHSDVKTELQAQAVEAATELRALEYGRLSKAYAKAMEVMDAASGEMALKAVDRVERLSRSMRVLFGLDVPVRIDVTHHELSQQDVELQELLNEANAANANELARIADERTDTGS